MRLLLLFDSDTVARSAALATAALARKIRKVHGSNGVKLDDRDPGLICLTLTMTLGSGTKPIQARYVGLKSDVRNLSLVGPSKA